MTKNPLAALSDFDAAIALDAAHFQAFYSRSLVQRKLGRWQESVADLEAALRSSRAYFASPLIKPLARRGAERALARAIGRG